MGTYCELVLNCDLKEDIPPEVITVLQCIVDASQFKPVDTASIAVPQDKYFDAGAWEELCILETFPMPGVPFAVFKQGSDWWPFRLTLRGIDKRCTNMSWFVEWLSPYIETQGYVGYQYEEEDYEIELLFAGHGKIHRKIVNLRDSLNWYHDEENIRVLWEDTIARGDFSLPLLEWCDVPEGYVTIESQRVLVPAFRIAKYPVTNEQFEAFVNAPNGFKNDQWWVGLARRSTSPGIQKWPIDEHPCANVRWDSAVAFSRWLSALTRLSVTLPTEAQWQRAAQGDDGRLYPWGNEFDQNRCNTVESRLRMTTRVDRSPESASPFGVVDMIGNVWEWCLTKWAESYQYPEDVSLEGEVTRSMRGGSFVTPHSEANAVHRDNCPPDIFLGNCGFRLVVVSASDE